MQFGNFIRFSTLLLILFACFKREGEAATTEWRKFDTPHFSLLTSSLDPRAPEVLEILERFRTALLGTEWKEDVPEKTVEVILCRGEREFKEYSNISGAFAFYTHRAGHDFIVLKALTPQFVIVAQHEYMHAVLQRAGGRFIPLWLDEGTAQVYSSVRWIGENVVIGTEFQKRPSTFDLTAIVGNFSTSSYPEPLNLPRFYAPSWALSHMLALDPKYRSNFQAFLHRLAQGEPASQAMEQTYELPLDALQKLVAEYLRAEDLPTITFPMPCSFSSAKPVARYPSPIEIATTQAFLRINDLASLPESERALELTFKSGDVDVRVAECLGFLYTRSNRQKDAVDYLDTALKRGSHNPEIILLYAQLASQVGVAPQKILRLVQQASLPEQRNQEISLIEGQLAAQAGEYDLAIQLMSSVEFDSKSKRYAQFYTLAYCAINKGNNELAYDYASRAKAYAVKAQDLERADSILRLAQERSFLRQGG